MPFNIFGFEISRKKNNKNEQPVSKITSNTSEGSVTNLISNANNYNPYLYDTPGGAYAWNFDLNGQVMTSNQMLEQYRLISCYPDVDTAIESIVNEAIITEQGMPPVSLNLDNLDSQYESIRDSIQSHFQHIVNLLDFNRNGHDIFKRWYVDGRIFYYINIDSKNPKKGILSLDFIDPLKIRKVVEIVKKKDEVTGVDFVVDTKEYYIFNDNGLSLEGTGVNIKLDTDCVINVQSGLVDPRTKETLSYLFKAIKPANQLKMMEDAVVIYRITRAPERRVFYIDVGNLPQGSAEAYVNKIIEKFRNKIVYNAETGEIKDNRQYLSMMEDFFLPRREGGKSTEIQVLPSASNLDSIGDLLYFQNKLYQALNVPRTRLATDNVNSIGGVTEITREEIVFSKFIQRLRNKFNTLFQEALRVELLLTNVIKQSDWNVIRNQIYFEYQHDNYFEELKRLEINSQRFSQLQAVDGFKGIYFSKKYIVNNLLEINDEEWAEMLEQMKQEKVDEAKETYELEHISDELDKMREEAEQEAEREREQEDSDPDYNDFLNGHESDEEPEDDSEEFSDEEEPPKRERPKPRHGRKDDSEPVENDESESESETNEEPEDTEEQEGDVTETVDDRVKPNPGEDKFTRSAEIGLKATR